MAHLIDVSFNRKGAFIARLVPGWHGLGEVQPEWTMEQILAHPGMAYEVGLENLTTDSGKVVPGQYATVRSDTLAPLSIVGDRYEVLQHTSEFKLFDEVLMPEGYVYETAGVLRGGAEVFLLAKRPETLVVAQGDESKQYLLLLFSYDGKSCQRIKLVNQRVVCANTLAIAIGESARTDIKLRHTASITDRMEDFRATLATATLAFDRFNGQARYMAKTEVTAQMVTDTMSAVISNALGSLKPNADDKAVVAYRTASTEILNAIGQKLTEPNQLVGGIEGSKWALYNAISEWADHTFAKGVKGTNRAKAERRFVSIVGGHAHDIKQAAWGQLVAAA